MYYLKDNHLYRYYCSYNGQLFKTEKEYLDYLNDNNIQPQEIYLWRKAKVCSKNHFNKDGSWKAFNIAPGTEVFDERDISQYYVKDEKAKERLLKCYEKYNDFYIDRCYFDGYDNLGDFTYSDTGDDVPEFNPDEENKTYAFIIISYLPDDENMRAERLSAHKLQIKNLKRLAPNTRIYIIAQNWHDDEYADDPQITYCKYGKLGAGLARNTAFKLLYDSDYDYGIVSDDDITLKETDSAKEFFREIKEKPEKFLDMDVIQTRCLIYNMLDQSDLDMADYTSRNWHFVQAYEGQIHLCFFKNFKKYYNTEEYQREDISPLDDSGFDDTDFFLGLNGKQYKVYMATFLYRYLGCMLESQSIMEDTKNGCYVYDNLTATRYRHMQRFVDGGWDYWKLRSPLPDINIPREKIGNVYDEIDSHLIRELKQRLEQEKNQENTKKQIYENPENGEYEIF